MSGWLTVDVLRGKDFPQQHCYVDVECGWGEVPAMNEGEDAEDELISKDRHRVLTGTVKGSTPKFNRRCLFRTEKASGKVTLSLYRDVSQGSVATTVMTLGVNKLVNSVQKDKLLGTVTLDVAAASVGEGWFSFAKSTAAPKDPTSPASPAVHASDPDVYIMWRCTYSQFAGLLADTDEEAPPPYECETYSTAQLQVEVTRLNAHMMAFLTPLWWAMRQWVWEQPYESAVTLAIGLYVCWHNMLHVAFPGVCFIGMALSFIRRFKQGCKDPPPPPAMGFLSTINWVQETLKWTQGYLMWVCDTLDWFYDIYMWEDQKAAEGLLKGCAVLFCLHWVLNFSWDAVLFAFWFYMYTYYPLGYYLPQLYIALLPQNVVPVALKALRGEPISMRKDGALHIAALLIPAEERRKDKSVHYKLVITNADGDDHVVWHRFSDFDKLRQRLEYIEPDVRVDGFPSKTMFGGAKGETLTRRRMAFEGWLTTYVEKANTSSGKPLRAPLAAFLGIEI